MIVQAATRHELISKKLVVILQAISDKFHKIWMMQLSQIVDFRL